MRIYTDKHPRGETFPLSRKQAKEILGRHGFESFWFRDRRRWRWYEDRKKGDYDKFLVILEVHRNFGFLLEPPDPDVPYVYQGGTFTVPAESWSEELQAEFIECFQRETQDWMTELSRLTDLQLSRGPTLTFGLKGGKIESWRSEY